MSNFDLNIFTSLEIIQKNFESFTVKDLISFLVLFRKINRRKRNMSDPPLLHTRIKSRYGGRFQRKVFFIACMEPMQSRIEEKMGLKKENTQENQ